MIIALYKIENKILKTTNLAKKEKKLGKLDVIWAEEFNGSITEGEAILDNKIKELSYKEESSNDIDLYYYKNINTNYWLISIYKQAPSEEWINVSKKEYEQWNNEKNAPRQKIGERNS